MISTFQRRVLPIIILFGASCFAQKPASTVVIGSAQPAAKAPKLSDKAITPQERLQLIRDLNGEAIQVKMPFPMGKEGLTLHNGVVTPGDKDLERQVATRGVAAKPGDKAQITDIQFKNNEVWVELNGGPQKKKKWYQRVSVAGMGGMTEVSPQSAKDANATGSVLEVKFDKFIPSMTSVELKKVLEPVLDFTPRVGTDAYMESLPPKLKAAIKEHRVLVGMDRDLVVLARGRPEQKIRERNETGETEEWVYGHPPQDVEFVKFNGEEVVQDKMMKSGGEKVVRTEKEIDLSQIGQTESAQAKPQETQSRPSMRREGEDEAPQIKTQ